MEKITKKFLSKLHFKRNHSSGLMDLCRKLKVGEMVFVSKEDWKGYRNRPKPKLPKKSISVKKCEEGWVLTRTK